MEEQRSPVGGELTVIRDIPVDKIRKAVKGTNQGDEWIDAVISVIEAALILAYKPDFQTSARA